MNFKATDYVLENVADGHVFEDSLWCLSDPSFTGGASLVRARYAEKQFKPDESQEGLFRYHCWLPVKRAIKGSSAPVTYRSKALASVLGLDNLFITFSGWNPAIGASFRTCSFKETEAYSVCGRLPEGEKRTLVVASAGNTARAFADVCSRNGIALVLVIPEDNLNALWFDAPLGESVKIVATPHGSDYFDAIALADKLCTDGRFLAEGGAKNIARRDGMGTTLLSAVEAIGSVPDAYFQAVGSGTGAIAVWENNMRLIADGRFSDKKMRLMTSQNAPFTIIYDSWKLHRRALVDLAAEKGRAAVCEIKAKVLSNRKPPYSLAGGLFDALSDTGGTVYSVTNTELEKWQAAFADLEGCDIHPAAGVAVASLAGAVKRGEVKRSEVIMLNVTGGGEKLMRQSLCGRLHQPKPHLILSPSGEADMIVRQVTSIL